MRSMLMLACVVGLGLFTLSAAPGEGTAGKWLGNKIGISDTPPPPFEPVRFRISDFGFRNDHQTRAKSAIRNPQSAMLIGCWGRSYSLGALGLPKRIRSLNKDLLAGPVELRITRGGVVLPWRETRRTVKKAAKVEVVIEGTAKNDVGMMEWRCKAEYDGLVRHDFALHPVAGATVERMELVFPLKNECATLFYLAPGARGQLYPINTGWWNYWWIGNEERGLTSFCETEEACDRAGRTDSFRVKPLTDGQTVETAWVFAAQPWRLPDPWRFTFALQATPVKDSRANWHRFRASAPGANVHVPWPNPATQLYFTPPEPRNITQYRQMVREAHAKGQKVVPYSQLTWISSATPQWKAHQTEWTRPDNERNDTSPDVMAFGVPVVCVRPTQTWIDFCVWNNHRLLEELDLDGIYVDFAMTQFWEETRGGQRMRYWPFFAVREVFKRTYTMLKQDDPDNILIAHMSPHLETQTLAFADIYLDGEGNWVGQLKDNYLDLIPLAAFRAEFMGHQYGIIPWFLPQWYGAKLEAKDVAKWQANGQPEQVTVEKSMHLLGLGLLHDFNLWPICGQNSEANAQFYRVLDEFGYQDARFFGYWNNADLIGGQSEAIKASVYRRRRGGALLCVYNVTREPQTATLRVAWDRLKGPGLLKVNDAFSKESISVDGDSINLEVPPLNCRLLWVR